MTRRRILSVALSLVVVGSFAACESDSDEGASDDLKTEVVAHYADGVHASYVASAASAKKLDETLAAFVATPSADTLEAAKQQWLSARDDYGVTEAFRFYGGPIDNEDDGPEGLINAWPMDEAYVDYVEGNATSGIINDATTYPEITGDVLESLNEKGGEANISTGWHAIEFLLWGQDLSETGPGARPATDYTTAPNAERRKAYLTTASELLVGHLDDLVTAWAPDADNYRTTFEEQDVDKSLVAIITGIGELSRGELAGERMSVAYNERSQEDEHSCFSDNTTNDIVNNATSIKNVVTGAYPGGKSGPGIAALVQAGDAALATKLTAQVTASVTLAEAIPAPFDQALREGVADTDPSRAAILKTVESLESQTDTIVAAARAEGLTIKVS